MRPESSRPYQKRERARQEQETRRRITEAAVELHGTVGPAKTKMTDVARLAGVSRMTVYNHFPSEVELFIACSTHWAAQNPFPDPSEWATIEDPSQRLVEALRELYFWYDAKQGMLGNVMRDTSLMPALATVMRDFWNPWVEAIVEALASGWFDRKADQSALSAAVRLAVSFEAWRVLTGSGLDSGDAAELAARMVTRLVRLPV